MKYIHTGLAVSSEEKADRFYCDILGLEKSESRIIDRQIVRTLFGIDHELTMIHYQGGTVDFELFVQKGYKAPERQIAHTCIKVANLSDVLARCLKAGIRVVEVPKKSGNITFISDYDGNFFELKA